MAFVQVSLHYPAPPVNNWRILLDVLADVSYCILYQSSKNNSGNGNFFLHLQCFKTVDWKGICDLQNIPLFSSCQHLVALSQSWTCKALSLVYTSACLMVAVSDCMCPDS